MADFTHLHNHSTYSLLDGMNKLTDMCKRAKNLGMSSLALTDHGNMTGVIRFYEEAKKAGIKPIFGIEGYIVKDRFKEDRNNYHIILLAKNQVGYKNLIKLSSESYTTGFYQKPRMDFQLLKDHSEGLIATTACLKGIVTNMLYKGQTDDAIDILNIMKGIFKEDLYVEVMNHGIEEQLTVLPMLENLASDHGLKVICTNDCHYLMREDSDAHGALLCVQTKTTIHDPKRMKYGTDQFYLKSPDEMASLFPSEYLSNTMEIADKCNVELSLGKTYFPVFKIEKDPDFETWMVGRKDSGKETVSDKYLRYLCINRLKQYLKSGTIDVTNKDRYISRLKTELAILMDKKFSDYFLVVQDYINWARSQGIFVGPGRGSAAGSLTSYLLDITQVDPIHYGLLFERFINPHRSDFPDIDVDFQDTRRQEVIDYIINKYGREKTCLIGTQSKMNAKVCVKDVARALGYSVADQNRISERIPQQEQAEQKKPMLAEYRKTLPAVAEIAQEFAEVFRLAEKIELIHRHTGVHAAGIIISSENISDIVPLCTAKQTGKKERVVVAQFEKKDLEKSGLVKVDILGLRQLSIVQEALKLIRERHNIDVNLPR